MRVPFRPSSDPFRISLSLPSPREKKRKKSILLFFGITTPSRLKRRVFLFPEEFHFDFIPFKLL
jgi:hypothetical protein